MHNQTKAEQIRWTKVPSVTCGGAAYFYNTVTDDYASRRSVVWDRTHENWCVKGPQTLEHYHGRIFAHFNSVGEAKRFVELGLAV